VLFERSLGVQLHPTSLPAGRLGRDARAFVDWLAAAGARWWQVLPLNPPDEHGSPYASASAFALWGGLLEDPEAPVAPSETRSFLARQSAWAREWVEFAGPGALEEQVRCEREWEGLRSYARERGVRVIGDIPIYVAQRSCDHLSHPYLFLPGSLVAGAPPDALNGDGQVWGNPLYDWDALARTGYAWWVERLRRMLRLADVCRIDHFRGFAGYWAVPAGASSARTGHWRPGPGAAVFDACAAVLGPLPLVADDLGVLSPDVHALREELGFPGMAVLLWAFGGRADSPHRLENHRANQVVYTSTHDSDTLAGHFGTDDSWALVELALSSPAALTVVPVQDVLGLGSEARMNTPGTTEGNWRWRLQPGQLAPGEAARLRRAAETAGRA
jgi:4-alpha-glucanotransferase